MLLLALLGLLLRCLCGIVGFQRRMREEVEGEMYLGRLIANRDKVLAWAEDLKEEHNYRLIGWEVDQRARHIRLNGLEEVQMELCIRH